MKMSYSIHLIVFVFCFVCINRAFAQKCPTDETVKRDSTLFYHYGLNKEVCPMLPFELGLECDSFLKGKEYSEKQKRKRNYGAHPFTYTASSEIVDYHMACNNFYRKESSEIEMQDKWNYYKKKYKAQYSSYHPADYDEAAEKALLVGRLMAFGDSAAFKPLFYYTIKEKYQNNVRAYVDDLYKTSMMSNKKRLRRFMLRPKQKRLNEDLGVQMVIAVKLYKYWLANRQKIDNRFIGRFVYQTEEAE